MRISTLVFGFGCGLGGALAPLAAALSLAGLFLTRPGAPPHGLRRRRAVHTRNLFSEENAEVWRDDPLALVHGFAYLLERFVLNGGHDVSANIASCRNGVAE